MTPEELRRLAQRSRTAARARLAASGDLVTIVRACRGVLDRVLVDSRSAWTGRAAAGFLGVATDRRRLLDRTIGHLLEEEARLVGHAEQLFAEANRLDRLADEIEASGSLATLAS